MGSRINPERRIVPPAMPPPAAPSPAAAYVPPKYDKPKKRSPQRTVAVYGTCLAVIVVTVYVFRNIMLPHEMRETLELHAQAASNKQQANDDAMRGGWVGVLELPAERAVISINTLPDDSKAATDFAANVQQPVSLAVLSIDNSSGVSDLFVDPTQGKLQLADGSSTTVLDTTAVYSSAKSDPSAAKMSVPPYRCPAGMRIVGKYIFMPKGTDPQRLTSVTLSINGLAKTVAGSYMDEAKKAEMIRTQGFKVGRGT